MPDAPQQPQQPQQPRIQCRECQAVNLLGQPTCRKCGAALPQKAATRPAAAIPTAQRVAVATAQKPAGAAATGGAAKIAAPTQRVGTASGMPQINVGPKSAVAKRIPETGAPNFAVEAAPDQFAVSAKRAFANLPDQPPVSLMTMHHLTGRITRTDYWIYTLVSSALGVVLMIAALGLGYVLGEREPVISGLLAFAVYIFMFWIAFALQARRFHDHGMSGWWTLINFVPFGGLYALAMCGFVEGTKGPNKYGADPCRRGMR